MLSPTRIGAMAAAATLGLALGAGAFTFSYGQGASYLTNDPAACANCHVMEEQFAGWLQSSHRTVATCNDCHAPHDLLGKYWTKATNGWAHSVAFTTGEYPEYIRIKPGNLRVTEEACRDCHETVSTAVDGVADHDPRPCVTCHADVGHRAGPLVRPGSTITHRSLEGNHVR